MLETQIHLETSFGLSLLHTQNFIWLYTKTLIFKESKQLLSHRNYDCIITFTKSLNYKFIPAQ